jgi:hypothetical protein
VPPVGGRAEAAVVLWFNRSILFAVIARSAATKQSPAGRLGGPRLLRFARNDEFPEKDRLSESEQ